MDCGSNYESSILSGHPIAMGVRLVASRQSLELASGVRFVHPLPMARSSIGGAAGSDPAGSRFEAWRASQFFTRVSFKGKDGTLRTFRLGFDSSYPYHSGLLKRCDLSSSLKRADQLNRVRQTAMRRDAAAGAIDSPTPEFLRCVGGVRSPRLPVTQETTGSKPVRTASFDFSRRR